MEICYAYSIICRYDDVRRVWSASDIIFLRVWDAELEELGSMRSAAGVTINLPSPP